MSRHVLMLSLLGLTLCATGAEPDDDDDDDHEHIIAIAQAPTPVQQIIIHEQMDHVERIFHELEHRNGRFKAEFCGPDGDGFIEIDNKGTIVRRMGACQSWPSITLEAIPLAARNALTHMIGNARIEHLEYQTPTNVIDKRLIQEATRYRAVFVDDGLCTAVTVAANGELVQLHTSRKE